MRKLTHFPFPVIIGRENKWFVAECPVFNIATQGKTESEVKENMADLIKEYLKDPDVPKVRLEKITPPSLTYIPVSITKELL